MLRKKVTVAFSFYSDDIQLGLSPLEEQIHFLSLTLMQFS